MSDAELEIVVLSKVSELVEEFKESSVPPLHEIIIILTKKVINMTIIFFTLSSNIFCGKKLNSRSYFIY